ncbi:MAG TPA: DeoR/GlpR family DNA-binding transcription regulator [Bryobacteraceae bacterium]|nr:DeoR/GlpR family DNA-binding transcription regulator [Bryobacteraceae bacterium]
MKAPGRHLKIRALLDAQEFVDLETLCRELDASESSVRRDLVQLEAEGELRRVYGGAMAVRRDGNGRESHREQGLDFDWQSTRQADEKRRIAAKTAELIEDRQTVILDGGSTVAAVARELKNRSLHVITNSVPIAMAFEDKRQIEVTLTGGFFYPRLRVTLGPLCEQMLSGVAADVLIMGIGGISADGFSNGNSLVVGSERKMIEVARKVIIVADHTKFGRNAMLQVAPLNVADCVVTDSALAPEYREMLRAQGVEVLLA